MALMASTLCSSTLPPVIAMPSSASEADVPDAAGALTAPDEAAGAELEEPEPPQAARPSAITSAMHTATSFFISTILLFQQVHIYRRALRSGDRCGRPVV